MICGDFNICALKNPKNFLTQSLVAEKYQQIVKYSTHEKGGLLEHVYVKNTPEKCNIYHHSVYYSDHDGICITFGSVEQSSEKNSPKRKYDDINIEKDFKQTKVPKKRKSSIIAHERDSKLSKISEKVDLQKPLKQSMDMYVCVVCFKSEAKCDCYVDTANF